MTIPPFYYILSNNKDLLHFFKLNFLLFQEFIVRIIPIASGKGGVGKSLFSVNLSIALAEAGNRVLLADLDLGASNAHTVLGLRAVTKGIGCFFTNPDTSIDSLILDTEYPNLRFLPGEGEIPGLANIKASQKNRLIRQLRKQNVDYLILDLGAGTALMTIDFFLLSSEGIIVTTPNLTAILNAYLFLKNTIFRILWQSFPRKSPGRLPLEKISNDPGALQKIYLPSLFEQLKTADPDNFQRFYQLFRVFRPKLIMNMVENPKDSAKAQKIKVSCKQYLGLELDHYGVIYKDHLQDIALASRLPIIRYKRESLIPQAIYRIAEKIEQTQPLSLDPFELELEVDENYQTADKEAESDFEFRSAEIQKMVNSGVLTNTDFLELIRQQQYELKSLRTENHLLRTKLANAIRQGFKI